MAQAEVDITTPPADTVTVFADADDGNAPAFKDETGTVTPLQGAPGSPAPPLSYQDHGNTGSTETVDASAADVHRLVANAATVTLTLTGAPAAGTPAVIQLWLEQDGTGGRDWAFPGSVDFGDAGEPDWTTRSGGAIDLVSLETVDGGTVWVATIAGRAGAPGAPGADGIDGATGGAIVVDYTFSTTTTDSDPGNGNLRLSNATQNAATVIRADLLDVHGATRTSTLDSLDDSTNTVKGHLRLFKTDDPTKFLLFTLTSIASPSGYRNITVVNVDSSASSPFANGDPVTLAFTRAGDVGASGTASVGSDPIWDAKGDLAAAIAADTAVRLPVGANGQGIVADSAETTGLKWVEILPWRIDINPVVGMPVNTGFAYGNISSAQWADDGMISTAQNDEIGCDVVLAAGTWSVFVHGYRFTSRGIATISLDGSSIGTLDFYGADTANFIQSLTGVTVAVSGKKAFKLKMATKNGSSSGYGMWLTWITLVRTA